MSNVSVIKCGSYDQHLVDLAIHQALGFLGGISQFVKPGQKVLIKPNALMAGSSPEAAITTHPSIISAVVKEVVSAGAAAFVGDSPGNAYANVPKTLEKTGLKKAAEEAGGKVIYFQQEGVATVKSPSGNRKISSIPIAKLVFQVDCIINLPKLKTHNLTLVTGAIKNNFGLVPGFHKARFHIAAPNPRNLAESIVDVFEIAKPKLNIMDAVVGMEGPGPSSGSPRKLGVILASTDGVALDAVSSYLIGYQPSQIDTTVIAHKRKLGKGSLENIEVLGARLEEVRQANWKHAVNVHWLTKRLPGIIYDLITPIANRVRIDPVIDQEKCTKCLVCVKNCPAQTINYDKTRKVVKIDLKNCISCYCCHELCEYRAITLRSSWLTKLLGIAQ